MKKLIVIEIGAENLVLSYIGKICLRGFDKT